MLFYGLEYFSASRTLVKLDWLEIHHSDLEPDSPLPQNYLPDAPKVITRTPMVFPKSTFDLIFKTPLKPRSVFCFMHFPPVLTIDDESTDHLALTFQH